MDSMEGFRKMTISGVVVDPDSKAPTLVLKDDDGRFLLPIWVGVMEAGAVTAALEGVVSPRPMTHELIVNILETLGATLESVRITALEHDTFHAGIEILVESRNGPRRRSIDCRASDALALAARTSAPIFVRQDVVAAAAIVVQTAGLGVGAGTGALEELLASLPDEVFGKYET